MCRDGDLFDTPPDGLAASVRAGSTTLRSSLVYAVASVPHAAEGPRHPPAQPHGDVRQAASELLPVEPLEQSSERHRFRRVHPSGPRSLEPTGLLQPLSGPIPSPKRRQAVLPSRGSPRGPNGVRDGLHDPWRCITEARVAVEGPAVTGNGQEHGPVVPETDSPDGGPAGSQQGQDRGAWRFDGHRTNISADGRLPLVQHPITLYRLRLHPPRQGSR
jgi:hypothetical protein